MTSSDDLKRASRETADRLAALGIGLTGRESAEDLVEIQEAVQRFEQAVESRGGDLMVDEGVPGRTPEPDDPPGPIPPLAADPRGGIPRASRTRDRFGATTSQAGVTRGLSEPKPHASNRRWGFVLIVTWTQVRRNRRSVSPRMPVRAASC